jgi:hypothetical protein
MDWREVITSMKNRSLFQVLLFTLLTASAALAQVNRATLNGRVQDSSGGAIPGAAIVVTNTATNVSRQTTSNAEGYYSVADLIPGTYRLTANFKGFKRLEREGIVLQVGDRIALDLHMELGTQTESVVVTGEVPMLRVDDTTTGLVIDSRRIEELPQWNRNPLALALMTPNVNGTNEQIGHANTNNFRINGGRTSQVEYMVDGVPATTAYEHEVAASVPSKEAVSEFRVLTNGFSAEIGRLSGGAISVVTRSGGNAFHGAAYEFFRNDKLNATSWATNRVGGTKTVYHDNIFGASFSGPITLPKIYDGRNKTFFFFNFEGVRNSSTGSATLASTPSTLEREGDFSQSLLKGKPVTIYDPLSGVSSGGKVVRTAFPANKIPTSRIDPLAAKYMSYYPLPNRAPNPNSSHEDNFLGYKRTQSGTDRFTGRLDQSWSSNQNTQFSITQFATHSQTPPWFSALQQSGYNETTAWTMGMTHTWTLNPPTLITARLGNVRDVRADNSIVGVDASNWGLSPETLKLLGTAKQRVPTLDTGDSTLTALGGGQVSETRETSYTASVALQKLMGKHALKAGYEHRRYYANIPSGGTVSLRSGIAATSQYYPATDSSGSELASWLLGIPLGGGGSQFAGPALLQPFHAAYVQDDIKLSSKLTVNLGVRWEIESPMTERFDRMFAFDEDYKWEISPRTDWSWANVLNQAGLSSSGLPTPAWISQGLYGRISVAGTPEYSGRSQRGVRPDRFSPRFGVAWQFLPRTVLRAGYGINYLTITGDTNISGSAWSGSMADTASLVGSLDGGLTYPASFSNPFPNGAGYTRAIHSTTGLNSQLLGQTLSPEMMNYNPGYEHVVHLGFQREIGSGQNAWVFELAYSGNFGRNLAFSGWGWHILEDAYHVLGPAGTKLYTMVDNPFYGILPSNTARGAAQVRFGSLYTRNPLYSDVWTIGNGVGSSNYNAGYLQVEHRFGRGFGFMANYTISKLLNDCGSLDGQQASGRQIDGVPQSGLPISDIYAIAKSDISQKLVLNFSVDIPVGRGKRFLGNPSGLAAKTLDHAVGGWRLAGMSTMRTGFPITPQQARASSSSKNGGWWIINQGKASRLKMTGEPYNNNVSGHTALQGSAGFTPYINVNAFRYVSGLEIGDQPATLPDMRMPSFSQWDVAILKDFRLRPESTTLQVRCEAVNFLNHMNAGDPVQDFSKSNFGYITSQSGSPRYLMLAVKLTF